MKKPKDSTLVIYGACAVTWTVLAVSKIIHRSEGDPMFVLILYGLCALLWMVSFVDRWRKNRSNQQDNPTTKQ